MTDGSSHTSTLLYNSRLQPSAFDISGSVVHQNYDYYDDGRINFVHNTSDSKFDRSYVHDHASRLLYAFSGADARQEAGDVPYYERFGYDAFSHTTSRFTETWVEQDFSDAATYIDNRRNGWGYDADGRIKTINNRQYNYDAAGDQIMLVGQVWTGASYAATTIANGIDGDGNKVKETSSYPSAVITYYLRSSVLKGAIVEELSGTAQKQTGYVYTPSGELLARQAGSVAWKHATPGGTGEYDTYADGFIHRVEFDPMGADVGLNAPAPPDTHGDPGDIGSNHNGGSMDSRYGDIGNPGAGCVRTIDGIEIPCGWFQTGVLSWMTSVFSQPVGGTTEQVWVPGKFRIAPNLHNPFDEFADDPIVRTGSNYMPGYWQTVTVDTVFGNTFLGGVQPQKITETTKYPLVNFKKLLQYTLAYGDCAEFLPRLIAKTGEILKGENNPVSTDIMTLYGMVNRQPRGGFHLNQSGPAYGYSYNGYVNVGGLSSNKGFAWGGWGSGNRTIWIYEQELPAKTTPLNIAQVPYQYALSAIEELWHVAAKGETYRHEKMNDAANALEPGLSFNDAIKKHCIPREILP